MKDFLGGFWGFVHFFFRFFILFLRGFFDFVKGVLFFYEFFGILGVILIEILMSGFFFKNFFSILRKCFLLQKQVQNLKIGKIVLVDNFKKVWTFADNSTCPSERGVFSISFASKFEYLLAHINCHVQNKINNNNIRIALGMKRKKIIVVDAAYFDSFKKNQINLSPF